MNYLAARRLTDGARERSMDEHQQLAFFERLNERLRQSIASSPAACSGDM